DRVLDYLDGNRARLTQWMATHMPDAGFIAPEGTYLAWLDGRSLALPKDTTPAAFFRRRARVALTDGRECGEAGDGFARLNFAMPRPLLDEALARMGTAITDLRAQPPLSTLRFRSPPQGGVVLGSVVLAGVADQGPGGGQERLQPRPPATGPTSTQGRLAWAGRTPGVPASGVGGIPGVAQGRRWRSRLKPLPQMEEQGARRACRVAVSSEVPVAGDGRRPGGSVGAQRAHAGFDVDPADARGHRFSRGLERKRDRVAPSGRRGEAQFVVVAAAGLP